MEFRTVLNAALRTSPPQNPPHLWSQLLGQRWPDDPLQKLGSLINRHCLAKELDAAYDMAILFGVQQPEPGPYVIVEVWRRATDA